MKNEPSKLLSKAEQPAGADGYSGDAGLKKGAGFYDLVVVIANWNTRDLLLECLASIQRSTGGLALRTVVVDNASSDGSAEAVAGKFPDVEIIQNTENVGFSRANNQALYRYQNDARYFLLLNPDTVVAPETFKTMIDFMDEHGDAGVCGCKIVTPQRTLDWACKRSFLTPSLLLYKALCLDKLFPESPRFGGYHLTYLDQDQIHEVDSVVGAFMMIRAQCLKSVGGLEECYYMYGEDIDFCFKTKADNWKIYYVPSTTIIHHKGQSTCKRSYRMIWHWYDAAGKFYRKRMAARYSWVTNGFVACGLIAMCGMSLAANVIRENKRVPSRR